MIHADIPSNKNYHTVIVGSGPAGISLALKLHQLTSQRIALIESGDANFDSTIYSLSDVVAEGDLDANYYPVHAQRRLGGTSAIWAGFCTTMERRAFINNEWPIAYDDLAKYYPEAAGILELDDAAWASPSQSINAQSSLQYKPFYLSSPVRFSEKYQPTLAQHPDIDVILRHTCVGFERAGAQVTAAILSPSEANQQTMRLPAKQVVLACGGLGNPKLLHAANIPNPRAVGRYFMEHPHLYGVANVELPRSMVDEIIKQDDKTVPVLQLGDDLCAEHGLMGMSMQFNRQLMKDSIILGKTVNTYRSRVNVRAEMAPDFDNCVLESEQKDFLGLPQSKIHFNFQYSAMAQQCWRVFARELLGTGQARASVLRLDKNKITGGGHYLGSTRMGKTAHSSVVDGNCQVHGLENVYVAGSSIFPAGGVANPTYTIVALSLRLASHLAEKNYPAII